MGGSCEHTPTGVIIDIEETYWLADEDEISALANELSETVPDMRFSFASKIISDSCPEAMGVNISFTNHNLSINISAWQELEDNEESEGGEQSHKVKKCWRFSGAFCQKT